MSEAADNMPLWLAEQWCRLVGHNIKTHPWQGSPGCWRRALVCRRCSWGFTEMTTSSCRPADVMEQ